MKTLNISFYRNGQAATAVVTFYPVCNCKSPNGRPDTGCRFDDVNVRLTYSSALNWNNNNITYILVQCSSAELRTFAGHAHPPPRELRKTLFTFHLWRPAAARAGSVPRLTQRSASNGRLHRSADPPSSNSLCVGWLNAQSLRNKTDAMSDL